LEEAKNNEQKKWSLYGSYLTKKMNFEVVIPTYKRKSDLRKCLDSIYKQEILPIKILLVDDDKLPNDFISHEKSRFLKKGVEIYHYVKNHNKEARGSNESKNIGLKIANEKIVFLFDDDVVLKNNFFKEIMNTWEKNEEENNLIGISGIAENYRKKRSLEKVYNKIFGLTGKHKWDVNDVAFQSWDTSIKEIEKGHYMSGFCCSLDRALANEIKFTIFKGGRAGGADPDFSLKAKNKGYYFLINPKAKVVHNQSPASREKAFETGFKETINRKTTFKNNCEKAFKNHLWFYWANIGWILRQFLTGRFLKGFGMIKGLLISTNEKRK
jgi:GT2 family glycosyltransferase